MSVADIYDAMTVKEVILRRIEIKLEKNDGLEHRGLYCNNGQKMVY